MKKLYKFQWDYSRGGDVKSIFIADEEIIKKNIGVDIYFGEIMGKHSEVYGILEEGDLKVLTEDQEFIIKFEQYVGKSFGRNPLDYTPENR